MATSSHRSGLVRRLREQQSARELLANLPQTTEWETVIPEKWYQFVWPTTKGAHTFLLREGRDRFMLLGEHHTTVNQFLELIGWEAHVRRPRIDVARFVADSIAPTNQPGVKFSRDYRLTNIYASVSDSGRRLQTVAFWGDDVVLSELYLKLQREEKPPPTPYRVTVRELKKGLDVCSVGSLGEVNFFFTNATQLLRIDTFFRFLKDQRYLQWNPGHTERKADVADLDSFEELEKLHEPPLSDA